MRSAVIRWLVIAVVIGFSIAFLNWALWIKPGVKYEPPISEAEIKTYQARPLADLQSFMKAREVHMTVAQTLSEELRDPYYWRWLGERSIVPTCGVFIALFVGAALERPFHSSPPR